MKLLLVQDKTDLNIPCVKLSDKEIEINKDKKGEKDLELDVEIGKSKSIR